MKNNTKEVPKTNYFILVAMIVLIISICTATYNLYSIYQDYEKGQVSPLNVGKEVDYSELSSTTNEMQEDSFLVLSYVGDEDIYENEKTLRLLFRKYELQDNIIYVNVTEDMESDDFIENTNETLNLTGDVKISEVPAIIYYKEGVPKAVVKSTNGIVDADSLKTIIEENINVG